MQQCGKHQAKHTSASPRLTGWQNIWRRFIHPFDVNSSGQTYICQPATDRLAEYFYISTDIKLSSVICH